MLETKSDVVQYYTRIKSDKSLRVVLDGPRANKGESLASLA
jgi:hypothetical protein